MRRLNRALDFCDDEAHHTTMIRKARMGLLMAQDCALIMLINVTILALFVLNWCISKIERILKVCKNSLCTSKLPTTNANGRVMKDLLSCTCVCLYA